MKQTKECQLTDCEDCQSPDFCGCDCHDWQGLMDEADEEEARRKASIEREAEANFAYYAED